MSPSAPSQLLKQKELKPPPMPSPAFSTAVPHIPMPPSDCCASDMMLHIHSNASCLSELKARSRAGGHFFLSNKPSALPIDSALRVASMRNATCTSQRALAISSQTVISGNDPPPTVVHNRCRRRSFNNNSPRYQLLRSAYDFSKVVVIIICHCLFSSSSDFTKAQPIRPLFSS